MIIPISCFTCGKVIGNKWNQYQNLINKEKKTEQEALDILKIKRYCCRRMLLTHQEIIDLLLKFKDIKVTTKSEIGHG